ncbi:unnamed protein product, partial [Durusdinium trenchii]
MAHGAHAIAPGRSEHDKAVMAVELAHSASETLTRPSRRGERENDKDEEKGDGDGDGERNEDRYRPRGPAGQVADLLYLVLSMMHLWLVYEQSTTTRTDGSLFLLLSGLQVSLAFEVCVYAAGGFAMQSKLLETAGRIRLFLGATAWVWLLPWAAELHCRCGPSSPTAILATQQGYSLAWFVTGFFALREVCVFVRGEPPSALDRSQPHQFGDCLPSNAVLGGQFRLDKAELEETGRAVFVPSRPR